LQPSRAPAPVAALRPSAKSAHILTKGAMLNWMASRRALVLLVLLSVFALAGHAPARADDPEQGNTPVHRSAALPPAARGGASLEDVVSPQGRAARGLYFTGPYIRRYGVEGILRSLRQGNLNAAVIDLKDDQGRVLFDTQVPLLADSRSPMLGDVRALVARLKTEGIYTIGRIVCFNDPIVPRAHPERAILDGRPRHTGLPWVSWGTGNTWLDPSNPENHALIRDLAVEVAGLGFDEVQLDYVRFPVDQGTSYAVFQHEREGARHWEYIASMLRMVDEAIHVPLGVDIFGISALRVGDPAGLGQSAEDWARYVEVYTPMLYANNFKSWTASEGTDRGASFVFAATQRLRERVGPNHVIRPFLQAFATGTERYDETFVAAQIRAARQAGANGFLFWNPASNFGTVMRAMHGPARGLAPFPERIALRVAQH
jgi:hypothetical protein